MADLFLGDVLVMEETGTALVFRLVGNLSLEINDNMAHALCPALTLVC